ncbi:MAG: hypothetical protein ACR2O3_12755 [Rhizobiaceae bacterium]
MSRLRKYIEIGPALFFSLMAVYCVSVFLIEAFSSSELMWAVFLSLTASLRHVLYFMESVFSLNIYQNMILFVFLGFVGFISTYKELRYFRFFYFHSAFLFVFFAMLADISSDVAMSTFAASASERPLLAVLNFKTISFYVSRMEGLKLFLLLSILLACTSWHATQVRRFFKKRG